MPRTAPKDADLIDVIAACLAEDDVVCGYVDGKIDRVGTFENLPRYIEIGHTRDDPVAGLHNDCHLVTVHVWSKGESSQEIHDVLRAAERAVSAMDDHLAPKREFAEVRYDDRYASFHGLLRLSLCPDGIPPTA